MKSNPTNDVTPFLDLGHGASSKCTGEKNVQGNKGKRVQVASHKDVEFDSEPVHRRCATKNCTDPLCPNKGQKCVEHGKQRLTCKVKGCYHFVKKHGLCTSHEQYGSTMDSTSEGTSGDAGIHTSVNESPPTLVGQRNEDIALGMSDNEYKQLMHHHFKEMDRNNKSVKQMSGEILKEFNARLKKSGGHFLRKKNDGFVRLGEKEALHIIRDNLYARFKTVDVWRDGGGENANQSEL